MPSFGAASNGKLAGCIARLQFLWRSVVLNYDCVVLEGARTPAQQADKVARGLSKTMDSKHVVTAAKPSAKASDVAPYPVVWPDESALTDLTPAQRAKIRKYVHEVGRFYHFAGYVKARAEALGIAICWGGDWDSDLDFTDQMFDDLDHFELKE